MPHVTGTLINAGAVLVGTVAGSLLGERFPQRVRETVMSVLGLVVILLGVTQGTAAFRPPLSTFTRGGVAGILIVLGSLLVGGILGELIGIERGLNALGDRLKARFGRGQSRFTEGFVLSSLVFCVGPLTILGSIQDGLRGDYSLLAVKAALDGFAALAFASVLGWGVGFSVITILVFQGGLSLAAQALARSVPDVPGSPAIAAMTAVGGAMILAIGLLLLEVKEFRVANLLPALVLAPAAVLAIERLH